jgi:hypothetical protein
MPIFLTFVRQGGVFARWEFVAAGPPMGQIAIAEPLAEPGETVLSPEAWALVSQHARGTRVQDLVHNCTKEKVRGVSQLSSPMLAFSRPTSHTLSHTLSFFVWLAVCLSISRRTRPSAPRQPSTATATPSPKSTITCVSTGWRTGCRRRRHCRRRACDSATLLCSGGGCNSFSVFLALVGRCMNVCPLLSPLVPPQRVPFPLSLTFAGTSPRRCSPSSKPVTTGTLRSCAMCRCSLSSARA